jgi:hypothetical protein
MFQVAIQIAPTIRGKLLSPIVLHRSAFKAAQACIAHHPWCSSLALYLRNLPLGLDLGKLMLVYIRYRRALRFFSVPHPLSQPRSKRCDSCRSGFLSWAVLGMRSGIRHGRKLSPGYRCSWSVPPLAITSTTSQFVFGQGLCCETSEQGSSDKPV